MTRLESKNRRIHLPRRVLLLLTPRSYRSKAFIEAAEKLNIEVVKAMDMQEELADYWNYPLGLEYGSLERSVEAILEFSAEHPIGAVLAVDDSGTLLAAEVSRVRQTRPLRMRQLDRPENGYRARNQVVTGIGLYRLRFESVSPGHLQIKKRRRHESHFRGGAGAHFAGGPPFPP